MKISDMKELAKRMTKKECSVRFIAGIYTDGEGNKICEMNQRFLQLQENVFEKYLNMMKHVYSTKVENNAVTAHINDAEVLNLLNRVIKTDLQNAEILHELFGLVAKNYDWHSKCLILIWNDTYDIPLMGKDGKLQDESEEVYSHIGCAICPVSLTSAGLRYNPENNCFGPRERDWVVSPPAAGFIYPAFENREVDLNKIMLYTASAVNPPHELWENGLRTDPVNTIAEMQEKFKTAVIRGMGGKERAVERIPHILKAMYQKEIHGEIGRVDDSFMRLACIQAKISSEESLEISREYAKMFANTNWPMTKHLLTSSIEKKIEEILKKEELQKLYADAAKELKGRTLREDIVRRLETLSEQK